MNDLDGAALNAAVVCLVNIVGAHSCCVCCILSMAAILVMCCCMAALYNRQMHDLVLSHDST